MPPKPKLKRVFSGITLTTNDVRSIAVLAELAGEVEVRANGARLMDVGQVDQVIAEDVVLDRLVVSVITRDGALEFVYEQSYVLVRADDEAPALREPFAAIVALLEAKPHAGFGRCSMDVSPADTWKPPAAFTTAPTREAPAVRPSSRVPTATPGGMLRRWFSALRGNRGGSRSRGSR
jgi:hypothetical protein